MTDPLHGSIFGTDPDEHDEAAHDPHDEPVTRSDETRGARRQNRTATRRRGTRKWLTLLVALVVLGGGGFAAYQFIAPIVRDANAPTDYPGPGSGTVDVTIAHGTSGRGIAKALVAADVVKSSDAYLDAAAKNDKAASIQPGVYTMAHQMKAADAVAWLTDGKHRAASVMITPGMRSSQAFAALSKGTKIPVAQYEAAAKQATAIGLPASAKGNIEGYLAPGSYDFPTKSTATDQLKQLVTSQREQLTAAEITPERAEHVLTVASLVEKEAGSQDFSKVARVIENRLADDMALQLDSTVNYVQNESHIATSDAARNSSSPYNTYKVKGLPPSPISSPGPQAIKAAAKPAEGSWLYFVTVDPCTHQTLFATTYAQHEENVRQFQNWLRAHPGSKCS